VRGGWRVIPEMAAAGLWSSAPDMARLTLELQRAYQGKPTVFLSREIVGEAFRTGPNGDWGLGIEFLGTGRNRTFGHGGDNVGYKCATRGSCDSGVGAVVLTNGDDGLVIVDELLSGIAERRGWAGLAPHPQPRDRPFDGAYECVGRYALRSDFELQVTLDTEGLRLHAVDQPPLRLELIDTNTYVTAPLDLKIAFTGEGLELDGQNAPRVLPA
jgi:hypothetical protein